MSTIEALEGVDRRSQSRLALLSTISMGYGKLEKLSAAGLPALSILLSTVHKIMLHRMILSTVHTDFYIACALWQS